MPKHIVTKEQIEEIMAHADQGLGHAEISSKVGVSAANVRYHTLIKHGGKIKNKAALRNELNNAKEQLEQEKRIHFSMQRKIDKLEAEVDLLTSLLMKAANFKG